MAKKPVLLCIMDGFGWVPEQTFGNAIAAAKKPNLDRLFETYPYTTIQASGMAVGLPGRWATARSATPTWARAASSISS